MTEQYEKTKQTGIMRTVILLAVARLAVNVTRRFPYPFVPELSRELSVPETSIQSVTGLQAGIGITSPLFGILADRYGRKRVMMGCLLVMGLAAVLAAELPVFGVFTLVMLIFGVGNMVFTPAVLAFIGDRVPYHRRGAAVGTIELAWAGALLFASPVVGYLLDVGTLRTVFIMLMVILFGAALLIGLTVPGDVPDKHQQQVTRINPLSALRLVSRSPMAIAALVFAASISVANEIIFINYGAFMETSFDLPLVELGAVTGVIAVAEVLGEFLVIGIADRFGKKRLALIGATVASLMYFLLPQLTGNLTLALIGLFVMFFASETGIVAAIPLYSEVLPEARAAMFSMIFGMNSLGRFAGSLIGGILYSTTGSFALLGMTSLVIGLFGAAVMWRFIVESVPIYKNTP